MVSYLKGHYSLHVFLLLLLLGSTKAMFNGEICVYVTEA